MEDRWQIICRILALLRAEMTNGAILPAAFENACPVNARRNCPVSVLKRAIVLPVILTRIRALWAILASSVAEDSNTCNRCPVVVSQISPSLRSPSSEIFGAEASIRASDEKAKGSPSPFTSRERRSRPVKTSHSSIQFYLVRDRDSVYDEIVTRRIPAMGIRDRPIAPRAPWQNGHAERLRNG